MLCYDFTDWFILMYCFVLYSFLQNFVAGGALSDKKKENYRNEKSWEVKTTKVIDHLSSLFTFLYRLYLNFKLFPFTNCIPTTISIGINCNNIVQNALFLSLCSLFNMRTIYIYIQKVADVKKIQNSIFNYFNGRNYVKCSFK